MQEKDEQGGQRKTEKKTNNLLRMEIKYMKDNDIEVVQVNNPSRQTEYDKRKNHKKIAGVVVRYHDMQILGQLIRGKSDEQKEFYFFSMPHFFFKMRSGKEVKKNIAGFTEKRKNDEFQAVVLRKLHEKQPDLFSKQRPKKRKEAK